MDCFASLAMTEYKLHGGVGFARFPTQFPRASRAISRKIFFSVNSSEFHARRPDFGFNSLKRWRGTILMNGC